MKVILGNENEETEDQPVDQAPLTDGADILAIFGEPKPHYVPVTVNLKGRAIEYHIERLSPKKEASIDAQIDRKNGRAISLMESDLANVNAAGIAISQTLHTKIGEGDDATYQRVFTLEQLVGRAEVKEGKVVKVKKVVGLFDHSDPEAKEFGDVLAALCYQVNPSLMPSVKKMAELAMRAQFGLAE